MFYVNPPKASEGSTHIVESGRAATERIKHNNPALEKPILTIFVEED